MPKETFTEQPRPADTPLGAFFETIKGLAEAEDFAAETIADLAAREPKFRALLDTPQSPDKHAEGPRLLDHEKAVLVACKLLIDGKLSYKKASAVMDLEGLRPSWERVERFAREHPSLVLGFALGHDIAKSDVASFFARDERGIAAGIGPKKRQHSPGAKREPSAPLTQGEENAAARKTYDRLYHAFAEDHPGLEDADLQRAFYETYGISISYITHESKALVGENLALLERLAKNLGLSDADRALLFFTIRHHVDDRLTFAKGAEDYATLSRIAAEAGVDPQDAMHFLQLSFLIDGTLGVRKRIEGREGFSISVDMLKKFWQAEQEYPAYLEQEEKKQRARELMHRLKLTAGEAELRGDALIALGLKPGPGFDRVVESLYAAIRGTEPFNEALVAHLPEEAKKKLRTRLEKAKEIYRLKK